MIQSEFVSLHVARQIFLTPKFLVQVVDEGSGSTRILERLPIPESASAEPCKLYHVTPVGNMTRKEGYDDFDRLASEFATGGQVPPEITRGRQWVASTYGNGDLASLRLTAGLSQGELATLCDIEQPHVSRYESGRTEPLVTTAGKMARALGVSIEVLLDAWGESRAANDRRVK